MSVTVTIETRCPRMREHVARLMGHVYGTPLPTCEECRTVRVTTVTEELPEWQAPGIQFDSTVEPSRVRDRGAGS